MPSKYFTILTNIGSALHANAQIQQTKVPWTHMALGDGGGVEVQPDQKQTGLVREVHRLPITAIDPHPTNPNWIVVEAVVPNNVGGWTVRETAIYGGTGVAQCIAVGNYPASYKPVLAEGAVREMVMRMIVEIGSTATVNLVIDPAVAIASRQFVDDSLAKAMAKISAGYMFEANHWLGARAAMPKGWFAMDGIQITELLVPSIREALVASGQDMVTEAEWQADPLKRGKWSAGANGWVRMPDWNGAQPGSIGGLYFGGDLGGARRGTVVGDAIRNITGAWGSDVFLGAGKNPAEGVFVDRNNSLQVVSNLVPSNGNRAGFDFDASKVVPTASENRPKSVYGTWIMRLYGGFTQLGSLNGEALVAEINALKTRASVLEGRQKALGDGQTRQSVTRVTNTVYTAPANQSVSLTVAATLNATGGFLGIQVLMSGTWVTVSGLLGSIVGDMLSASAVVMAGEQYRINVGNASITQAWECR